MDPQTTPDNDQIDDQQAPIQQHDDTPPTAPADDQGDGLPADHPLNDSVEESEAYHEGPPSVTDVPDTSAGQPPEDGVSGGTAPI